jgi:hypothetical protein
MVMSGCEYDVTSAACAKRPWRGKAVVTRFPECCFTAVQDVDLVVDEHVVLGRMAPLDVVELLLLMYPDEHPLLDRVADPRTSTMRGWKTTSPSERMPAAVRGPHASSPDRSDEHAPRGKLLLLGAGTVLRAVADSALVAFTAIPTACFTTHGFLLVLVDSVLWKCRRRCQEYPSSPRQCAEPSSRHLFRCSDRIPNTGGARWVSAVETRPLSSSESAATTLSCVVEYPSST